MIFGRHELYLYFETRAYSLHYEKFADGTVNPLLTTLDFPDNWLPIKLSQILRVSSGKSLKRTQLTEDGNVPVYGAHGIMGSYSEGFIEKGTLLIGRVGFYAGSIMRTKEFSWVTDNSLIVSSSSVVNSNFLELSLKHLNLGSLTSQTAQPVISGQKIYSQIIFLPPVNEQTKIVDSYNELISKVNTIEKEQEQLKQLATQLKQKVLDVAMQGKLVPQDPNDEPASVLLEKIRAEKQRLYEEGKIKKKDLVETELVKDGDNAYYRKIPKSWEFVVLNQVALNYDSHRKAVSASERRERNSRKKADDLYPYFGATGQAGWIDDYLLDEITILIGEDGAPFLDKLASKAYIVKGKYWVNNHAHVIKPLINATYLMDFFNSFDYTGFVNGTTRLKLTQTKLYSIPIPLAPENEQYRITLAINKMNQQLQKLI